MEVPRPLGGSNAAIHPLTGLAGATMAAADRSCAHPGVPEGSTKDSPTGRCFCSPPSFIFFLLNVFLITSSTEV